MRKINPVILFLTVILFMADTGVAQPLNIDSLTQLTRTAKKDTQKVHLYFVLANQFLDKDLNNARKYSQLGKSLSKELNYRKGVSDYYSVYSSILNFEGKFDSSLMLNLEAVDFAKENGDPEEIGRTMMNAGIAYMQLEEFEQAVKYIEGSRDIFVRNSIHQYRANTFNLLQMLYYSMRQYRKAVNNGLSAIQLLKNNKDETYLSEAYNLLGLNYIQLHIYDSAKYFLDKAGVLAIKNNNQIIQITTNLNYALIGLKLQQLDSIKYYCEKALAISRNQNASNFVGLAQFGLSYYFLLNKEYSKAILMADSALVLANTFNLRDLKQKVLPVISSVYYALQDSKKGFYYFDQYELLSDSILNESIAKNTVQIQKKFETERKEDHIRLQEGQLKQKSILIYFLVACVIAILIISLLIFRNHRNKQKLQQSKIDELETEKRLTVTEAVLKGEEQERARLAKDLHDGLGGFLSGIKFSLNDIKGNQVLSADNAQAFERSIDMLDSSINEMRRVAHNLMPEVLLKYGLDAALSDFCHEIQRSGVVHIRYQSIEFKDIKLKQSTALAVYRIVQELVNNTIKHALAKNVLVQLHASDQENTLSLTVEDDGNGFDTGVLKHASGMGWKNLQNRIDLLKGKIDLNSKPGKGTSVFIEMKM